jgi:hypothetical protein
VTTIVPALVLCLRGFAAQPRPLRLDITIQNAGAPPAFLATAIEEAADIWAAYGVDVRLNAHDAEHDADVRIAVRIAPSANPHSETGVLGSIAFEGDAPEPAIALYPAAASALMAAVASSRRENSWPAAPHDRVLARVLGRALAHEIGHFLLRSKIHSADGLMRAQQTGIDLMSPGHRGFVLTADEVRRLRANLPAAKG